MQISQKRRPSRINGKAQHPYPVPLFVWIDRERGEGAVTEAESSQRIRRQYGHFTSVIGNEPLANIAYGLLYSAESGRIRVDELEYAQRTCHVFNRCSKAARVDGAIRPCAATHLWSPLPLPASSGDTSARRSHASRQYG